MAGVKWLIAFLRLKWEERALDKKLVSEAYKQAGLEESWGAAIWVFENF